MRAMVAPLAFASHRRDSQEGQPMAATWEPGETPPGYGRITRGDRPIHRARPMSPQTTVETQTHQGYLTPEPDQTSHE